MIHQGQRLKELCKGRSASELAVKLGISRVYIYELFRKESIPSEIIDKICQMLTISPSVFFSPVSGGVTLVVLDGIFDAKEIKLPVLFIRAIGKTDDLTNNGHSLPG